MALRWGLTEGAYRKYSYLFSKPLPFKLQSHSPLSEATYIRDVIQYAHKNDLPGKEWYKKVSVSPQDDGSIDIKMRGHYNSVEATRYQTNTVFDILNMIANKTLVDEYRCHTTDSIHEVREMLSGFEEWEIIELDKHTVEFRKVKQEEISNE